MFKLSLGLLLAGLSMSASSTCDWSKPGEDPYTGRPDAAVHAFKSMPWLARHLLAARVGRSAPDDMVEIGRGSVRGGNWTYAPDIRHMHFGGGGRVCDEVGRLGWAPGHVEVARVWCTTVPFDANHYCVARPHVCGNYFVITWAGEKPSIGGAPASTPTSKVPNVPEPGSLALVGLGLACLILRKK